jgi:hypothetical protein
MVDPRSLLTPDRLDFAVKHRFFRHLLNGGDDDAERVYRWHIQARTGGRELRSWKVCLDDYTKACVDLLASMRGGYDPAQPVVVGSNGVLMDGAHRISCALLLRCQIKVMSAPQPSKARAWGRGEMIEQGIAASDLERIQSDFARL